MDKPRRAYCSATDRNVPVVPKPGARLGDTPSVRDAQILVCLDYGVRCTGAMCPLFTPLAMGRPSGQDLEVAVSRLG